MPKNKTPDVTADGGSADTPAVTPDADNGVRPAPYDATWINVAMAAKRADVTTQTVRNAYREHAAFKPAGREAFFTTKMVDGFGNPTDYDVVYLDASAVDTWIAARAEKASAGGNIGGKHSGAKRRIIRITDEQADALPKMDVDGKQVPAVTLADGTLVPLETPTGNVTRKKGKADEAPANGVEVTADEAASAADAGATLFDVALEEAPAA